MKEINKFVARVDATHGVVHRDMTHAYELAMFKKYGYNWKKKIRQLAEQLRLEQTRLEQAEVRDVQIAEAQLRGKEDV